MHISFDNPWYLLLIPVAVVFLLISQHFMFTRDKGTKLGQILIRGFLFLALILSLAGFGLKFTGKTTTTIYLLDVSDSVRDSKQDIVTFVNESVKNKKRRDNIAVIAFGEDTRVEQFISNDLAFNGFSTDVNTGATNLEEAVELALAQFPEDSAKRIVLVTDGNENEGSLKSVASEVIASGCVFEIKQLEENISDEVYVSDMSIPNQADIGEKFNIEVEVESNVACDATVKLYAGRTLKGEQKVHLQKGTNQFVFSDTQSDEGLKTYKVVVESQKDTVSVNNEFSAYTNIETQLPLLIVEGEVDNSYNFRKIMDSLDIGYDTVSPGTVPNEMPALMEYSAVVMVDVFAGDLRDGFVDLLDDYVKNNGGGLVMTGGSNSFGLGGYKDTPLEDMSPVYMDLNPENEVPVMAMAMVIDRSGSMEGFGVQSYLDLAKQSAAAAVDYLRPEDYVEVIAFNDTYSRVVAVQNVDDPKDIQQKIYSIPCDGGTSIYPALEAAIKDINKTDAMIKHVILLTDGQDYNNDYDDLIKIAQNAGITISCVAVGSGCNDVLLEHIATEGGGRIFYADYDTDLPRIFAQEVFLASNTYIVNEVFEPNITSNDKIIQDVFSEPGTNPMLYGYIATTKKERSIQILDSFQHDPILCYWQYGLGKTVAWTSDVSGEWSAEYSNWENNALLWHNIIKLISEDNGIEGTFATVEQSGNKAKVTYTTDEYSADTKVTANVYDEDGNLTEIELDPKKPGVYEAIVDTKDTGIYTINIQQKNKGEVYSSINTAAIMQYSLEYRFYPDNTLLEEFAASTGAVFIEDPKDVFANTPEFVKARFNLWLPLLILAALVFLIDIAVRRFHLSFGFINKMSEYREKKKFANEAKKKKEEAEALKAEVTAPEEDKPKSAVVNAASDSSFRGKNKTNSGKTKQFVRETDESDAAPKKKESEPEVNEGASAAAYFASINEKKKREAAANNTISKTFERDTKYQSDFKPENYPKKPAAPKKPQAPAGGSVTGAGMKTRVWVRDNDK